MKLYMFRTVLMTVIRSFSLYNFTHPLGHTGPITGSLYLYLFLLLCVQWKITDDGQRNCTKHVQFYPKNKFEILVHLVGFVIRIDHYARWPERYILHIFSYDTSRLFKRATFFPSSCSKKHKIFSTTETQIHLSVRSWNIFPSETTVIIAHQ